MDFIEGSGRMRFKTDYMTPIGILCLLSDSTLLLT